MRKVLFFFLFISLLFASCEGEGKFEKILFRTWDDPFDESPILELITPDGENPYVHVSWTRDEGADDVVVKRAEDSINPDFEVIFKTTGQDGFLTFSDRSIQSNKKYIYKIDKTRGKKNFDSKKLSHIFIDTELVLRSEYSNTSKISAKELSSVAAGKLYAIKYDCDNSIVRNENWFKIRIGAGHKANCKFELLETEIPNATQTHIKWFVDGQNINGKILKQGEIFEIENADGVDKEYYFKLFLDDESVSGKDKAVEVFKIQFLTIG